MKKEKININQYSVNNYWSNNYNKCERNGGRNKTLSIEKYLNKIWPYLKDIINNLQKSDILKIHLTIANNFISIDNDEERVMHSKSTNIEIMMNDEACKVKKELFDSLEYRFKKKIRISKG